MNHYLYVFSNNQEFIEAVNDFYKDDGINCNLLALEMPLASGIESGDIKVYGLFIDDNTTPEQEYANSQDALERYSPKDNGVYDNLAKEMEKQIPADYPYIEESKICRIFHELRKEATKEELYEKDIYEDTVMIYFKIKNYNDNDYDIIIDQDMVVRYFEVSKEDIDIKSVMMGFDIYKKELSNEEQEMAIDILERIMTIR